MQYYHIIVDLDIGGAEKMLLSLLSNLDNVRDHTVISLKKNGQLINEFKSTGATIIELGLNKSLWSFWRAIREINKIIQNGSTIVAWMYHGMLVGTIVKLVKRNRLISNIRHSDVGIKNNSFITFLIIRLLSILSGLSDLIIYNGNIAQINHKEIGFKSKSETIIDNGIDLSKFSFSKNEVCEKYRFWTSKKKRILTISRYNKIKGIDVLIEAIYTVKKNSPKDEFHLDLVGSGLDKSNASLQSLIHEYGLDDFITLHGVQKDIDTFYKRADMFVLPSLSEAFPNVLIEAMSTGLLCISTEVGDVSSILESDFIVNPGNAQDLANIISESFELSAEEVLTISTKNRHIIEEKFNIMKIINKYNELLR